MIERDDMGAPQGTRARLVGPAGRKVAPAHGEEGAALLITILVVVILTITVTEFMYSTWVDRSFAVGFRDSTKAYFALRSGVNVAARGLLMEAFRTGQVPALLAQSPIPIPLEDTYLFLSIADESAKIDLNRLGGTNCTNTVCQMPVFKNLLASMGLDTNIAEYVSDWITPNQNPSGDVWYAAQKNPYNCKHLPMDTLDELRRVREVTPEIYDKILKFVTIRSSGKINVNAAPIELLMSLASDTHNTPISQGDAQRLIDGRPFNAASDGGCSNLPLTIYGPVGCSSNAFSASASVTFNEVSRRADAIFTNVSATSAALTGFRIN